MCGNYNVTITRTITHINMMIGNIYILLYNYYFYTYIFLSL